MMARTMKPLNNQILFVQVLSAIQIKEWDKYTIEHEPISSAGLMERAAGKCTDWIEKHQWEERQFHIFCAKGNNGGDGLVIARRLLQAGYKIKVYILETGKEGAADFQINLHRLRSCHLAEVYFIQTNKTLPKIEVDDIVIDALFGLGLNKALEGIAEELVQHINKTKAVVIAIDVPSGLFIDQTSTGNAAICATYTLTFQCMKLALLMQENATHVGEVHVLDIGLHKDYLLQLSNKYELIDEELLRSIYKPRNAFTHKGSHGHALLVGGSYGKMGAIQLTAKACLRSGAGLTTALIPACGYNIMQTALPEAMVLVDQNERHLSTLPNDIEKYNAIGIGPGMGTHEDTVQLVSFIVRRYSKPLVIDADGLNCLSQHPELLKSLPAYSILTPHPKEFDRLFGKADNDFERLEIAKAKAIVLNSIIILKSHHTLIALPGGMCYFNSTGNAGLAKGGSGDVLTGIIAALLCQGYSSPQAAILGVFLHGFAADLALEDFSEESLIASDIIQYLPGAFNSISNHLKSQVD